jgi:hypothetical protein
MRSKKRRTGLKGKRNFKMENAKTIKGQNRTFRPKSSDAIIPRAREGKKLSISIQPPGILDII